ncbi:peptide chain release factor 2 [Buchnera aphidicola (Mollitrichosiphum nigrofasciatum)]|uniref:peptide chain release factor 2 n=1 Tax=Buchnera aphidicola TaxID=9 RepID=UPI0031B8A808
MFSVNYLKKYINSCAIRNKKIKKLFGYKQKKKKIIKINTIFNKTEIWKFPLKIKKLNKKKKNIENNIKKIKKINNMIIDTYELIKLFNNKENLDYENEIYKEIKKIDKKLEKIEIYVLFNNKNDSKNCYIDIQSGSGGIDAQDWAQMLLKMYLKWADKKKFKTQIINETIGEIAGIKSATIKISGLYAFGWLKTETGVHRLVRKSPFNSGQRRHTSFSSIFVYPEIDNNINIIINNTELRIDLYKSSGAGGQHVNKTESAVRITHIPTGTVTQSQEQRSQHKNKEQAMQQMKDKLYNLELKKKYKKKQIVEKKKSKIRWGNQIRSYILDNNLIKDLRTGIETNNIQNVLNGELDQFIKKNLKIIYRKKNDRKKK